MTNRLLFLGDGVVSYPIFLAFVIVLSGPAIGFDLRAQGVHIGKRPLVAETLNEREAQRAAIEVTLDAQKVCLDHRAIDISKSRTHADIGDRSMDDAVDGDERGVDP